MARVTVTPEAFALVFFDHARLVELVAEVCDAVGLPADLPVELAVNEASPLGKVALTSLDPVRLSVEGGALENAKQLRHMSEASVRDVCGRWMLRVKDRLSPGFAGAPADGDLTLPQATAWDVNCVGRAATLGLAGQKARRLYNFRNRHGFTDVADAVFERLWTSDGLTWADIEAACAETAEATAAA